MSKDSSFLEKSTLQS